MDQTDQYFVKFIADKNFIDEIKSYSLEHPDVIKIISEGEMSEVGLAAFDWKKANQVAVIVTIISGLADASEFIINHIDISREDKIVIQSECYREIEKNKNYTIQNIESFLIEINEKSLEEKQDNEETKENKNPK